MIELIDRINKTCVEDLEYRSLVAGQDYEVPIRNGKKVRYVNLDNAASTPPFKKVIQKINQFSEVYSSVHRGNGFKSLISTRIYDQTREIIGNFVGADLSKNTVIFVKNSTEAVNRVAGCFDFKKNDIILCTEMEHHSNDLPWRKRARVKYIRTTANGELDLDHFLRLIEKYRSKIRLVSITGASNVTGYINPIHRIARFVHQAGAKILVDAAQLIPHRSIDIQTDDHPEHIDFLVFSAHKLYAPFGTGVLIGPREFFNQHEPDHVGGGTIKIVTRNTAYWDETPERNEAGTPNVIGAVALASSIRVLQKIGMEQVEELETKLTKYLLHYLKKQKEITIYGLTMPNPAQRLGVISFNIDRIHHEQVARILSADYGIGVRNGCFCAHPYVLKLLKINKTEISHYQKMVLNGNKSEIPGLVRVSFGIYNTLEDIDRLIEALQQMCAGNYDRHTNYNLKLSEQSNAFCQEIFNFD